MQITKEIVYKYLKDKVGRATGDNGSSTFHTKVWGV